MIKIDKFAGIDNVNDPFTLPPNTLQEAENVDIDNAGTASGRAGYLERVAGSFHSVWSNQDKDIMLVVSGSTIKRINKDFSLDTIVTGLSSTNKMTFLQTVGDHIVYNNGVDVGLLAGLTESSFDVPTLEYQSAPFGCNNMAWYKSRLYLVKGNVVYYSDPYSYSIDLRYNMFQFNSDVSIIGTVDTGLYIGDQEKTYYVDNDPLSRKEVTNYPAIAGTIHPMSTDRLRLEQPAGSRAVIWASKHGTVIGLAGGRILETTRGRYEHSGDRGASVVYESSGNTKYLVNLFS
jgi:hypothetical protein